MYRRREKADLGFADGPYTEGVQVEDASFEEEQT